MITVVILYVRPFGEPTERLSDRIQASVPTGGTTSAAVSASSALAIHFASALRDFAHFEHSLWNEIGQSHD